ncbi:atrial natriuretic peptide receptor 2-like [Galleria mellonella]|uniref:Atrial natriuretic peptide receptor 2-like n=1 Tax=Galleria mellonella TaxID=7137 RepID=A0ABM3MPR2_GALME|nr:atrial natriuretic peptide receptor 2-like [Galleria mellonella]
MFRRLSVYKEINSVLLLYIMKSMKSVTLGLWRQISSYYELLKTMEGLSLTIMTAVHLTNVEPDQYSLATFQNYHMSMLEHLQTTLQYLQLEKMVEDIHILEQILNTYQISNIPSLMENGMPFTKDELILYTKKLHQHMHSLKNVQLRLWAAVKATARQDVWSARQTLAVGIVIFIIVLLASPVLVLLLRHIVQTIETFARSIDTSTQKLMAEKQKSDLLLSRMLPLPVLRRLRAQRTVPAEAFDAVTIFFSDIVGFTNISATSTPMEVINMLNMLYKLFDEKIMQYNVYKVETIGDAYMVVSGLPQRNGNRHASEIADMSLSLMRSLEGAKVPHRPQELLRVRAGVNTGPCVAGVVGTTMPRYCLFGDTINTASRMESTGEPMKIHISYTTKKALDEIGNYEIEPRGKLDVAGKGSMETFWLVGKVGGMQDESPRCLRLHDYDQNLLELIIKS